MSERVTDKPLPEILDIDQEFWDAVQKDKLLLQKCLDCGQVQFFPRPVCVRCFSRNLGWQESQGNGTIYSFTLVRVPRSRAYRRQVEKTGIPIVVALVDLDEGIRVMSEIIDSPIDKLALGAKVKLVFSEVEGANFKLPKFVLVK